MRVLICGAGVAGLTLALCLARRRHEVVVVERAARLRNDGYMLDFFGSGYDASERLGLLPDLASIHAPVERLVMVDPAGHERVSVPYATLRKQIFADRHFNFMRGDLLGLLHERVKGDCEIRWGTTIASLERGAQSVRVRLSDNTVEHPQLLVGADGVHSLVRRLTFGPEPAFGHFLGYHASAFIIDHPSHALDPGGAVMTLTAPHRQVTIYPIRGGRIATFFLYRARPARGEVLDISESGARRELRHAYAGMGWVVPELLDRCVSTPCGYFDTVEQIQMRRWSAGRVVLIGDACQCASALSGQGASMAVADAYVLAEQLQDGTDVGPALAAYERRLRSTVERQQKAARRMVKWLAPSSQALIALRNLAMRAAILPWVASAIRLRMAAGSIFR